MPQFYTLPTIVGEAKIANAIALGGAVEITDLAIGDGGGSLPTPDSDRESLVNEVRRAAINTSVVDEDNPNWIVVEQVLPPDIGGWTIREIGLYDTDGDLIAYGNYPETYKPVLSEGSGRTQTIRFVMQVSDTAAVTLKVDPSVVLATREYVDDEITEHAQSRNHPDATTTAKGMVQFGTSEETRQGNRTDRAAHLAGVKAAVDKHKEESQAHNASKIALSNPVKQAPDAENVDEALAALGAFAADGYQNIAVFDTAGVTEWKVPQILKDGRRKAYVVVDGAGAGAGRNDTGGGGGGGGGHAEKVIDLTGVETVTITIGLGGEGAPDGIGKADGTNGGTSSFGEYHSAEGGRGGTNWFGGPSGIGIGGDINTSLGCGGSAARNDGNSNGRYRGGIGGGPGGNTTGADASSTGGNATGPGGGGGGGNENAPGGNGADGQVIVRW
ncbi:phage tail protein [Chromohalobacter nigrandesensis]|uniref:phage tail protein n=1 Tax=Chromohalobacter nigrandesensis TaxID=119863 RepID=UPI001FF5FE41|nr:phage tail protein [Chromohalobacter nigrandesensis]MCK0744111.1 phage tail protein [Chromohalobacter nigrandesensis]